MQKKLNCILLIDDNESDNFFHRFVINEANCTKKVVDIESGQAALDYLNSKEGQDPPPDLIFLDINMPGIDGWEFLEEYRKLDKNLRERTVVVMLTTSYNPDDRDKAATIDCIRQFINKPMSVTIFQEILERYFGDENEIKDQVRQSGSEDTRDNIRLPENW